MSASGSEPSPLFLRPRGEVPHQLRLIAGRLTKLPNYKFRAVKTQDDEDAAYLYMVAQILDEQEVALPKRGWRYRARMRRTSWIERLGMRISAAMRGAA